MAKDQVLIVDDELDNRVMMRYFLESWGYEVELAANGEEALKQVEAKRPDLILLDLEMPVMDGFTTCNNLKENPETEDIPVIMFTGLESTADKVKGIRRGADDYVVKTVDPEEIQARIEMILRRFRRNEKRDDKAGGSDSAVLSGSLDEKHFPEALQLALAYGKSGTLRLKDGDREGSVFLKEGDVVHAVYDQLEGSDAFYELSLWSTGHFSYQVGEQTDKHTIQQSGTSLIMEATRRMDEWNLISSKIPSFDVALYKVSSSGAESVRLTKSDWKALSLVDGERTLRQIIDTLEADPFEVGRTIFGLITVGVLSLEPERQERDVFFDAVPEMRAEPVGGEPYELAARQWKLLSFIDGRRDLGELTNLCGISPRKMAELLKELAEKGFIRINKPRSKAEQPVNGSPAQTNTPSLEATAASVEAFQPRIRAIGFD